MTENLPRAGHREFAPAGGGERNGHYQRNLVTRAGKSERLEVPRDREGALATEVFERYKRVTSSAEEAILEMCLSEVSARKIAGITEALSKIRIGKDAVSRIASRLNEQQRPWRERPLKIAYPYSTYLKVDWRSSVTGLALLTAVGVNEEGFRKVLVVEVAVGEKGAAYAPLFRGLLDRVLRGVRLMISHDQEGLKAAVWGKLVGRNGSGASCTSSETCFRVGLPPRR